WAGRPQQGVIFRPTDVFLIPFSLLWGGFAIFWEISVLRARAGGVFFELWGIPFVLVGLYMVAGRFFMDSASRKKTWYGVTNHGVIISSGLTGQTTRSFSLRNLPQLTLSEGRKGGGQIILEAGSVQSQWFQGMSWAGVAQPAALLLEKDARRVYDLIRE